MSRGSQGTSSGGEMERQRSYRTDPSTSTQSFNMVEAVKRPGHGKRGTEIDLLINWFRIVQSQQFTSRRIFIYEVRMSEVRAAAAMRGGRGRGRGRGGHSATPTPSDITHPGTLSKIFWKLVREYQDIFPNRYRVVLEDGWRDDKKLFYTPDMLRMNDELTLHCDHPERPEKKVQMRIKCHKYFNFNLKGDVNTNEDAQWSAIFLKNLLSQNTRYAPGENASPNENELADRFAHFNGGMFFVPRTPKAPKVSVQPGVESWLGLYASVRRMENFDPVINLGLVNKLFVQMNLDLVSFYIAIHNDSGSGEALRADTLTPASCMTQRGAEDFNHKVRDIKLKCEWTPGKDKDDVVTGRVERHYRFLRLKEDTCAAKQWLLVEDERGQERVVKEFRGKDGRMRPVKRRLRDVRMDDWYAAQGKPLKYPNLPLCIVKSGKKEDLIPMEVLFTHDQPQKYIKLLDFYAKMRITKLLARDPTSHHKITMKMLNEKLDYGNDEFMKAMEISVNPHMIECDGRMLEPSPVLGKSESDDSLTKLEIHPEKGEFYVRRAVETSQKTIRFVVYKLTPSLEQREIREFYGGLVKKCLERGFIIPSSDHVKPPIFKEIPMTREDYDGSLARSIEDNLDAFAKSGKTKDEELVFLFFTRLMDDLYGEIKYICDILHGVVSQVVDESTVRKSNTKSLDERPSDHKSVHHHLCLKLNAKLGGVNQILAERGSVSGEEGGEWDEPEWGRMPSNEKTMFIGIDVIHPSPNSPIRDLSLAAIVASLDKNAAKYAVRIKVNSRCNESVQIFDEHFSHLLAKYHSVNGELPSRIVILRDGVSDSEMVQAASRELHSIKEAWIRSANGKPLPPFTYIVVQKNHKTRFYRRVDKTNPPMGTTVDKGTVTPHMFDFYMVSHHTQLGTSRPIHYTVVYDDSEASADAIQEMVFRMCFLYARCSKAVSLPSPVYYAHLACERAAFQHQYLIRCGDIEEIEDKGETESDHEYSVRVESKAQIIEEALQVSNKYPGMYFI